MFLSSVLTRKSGLEQQLEKDALTLAQGIFGELSVSSPVTSSRTVLR